MPSEEEFRRLAKQEISYDAWGRLRDPATHALYAQGSEPALFLGRGYTGHEHLTWFGVVNMNFAFEREQDEKNLFSIMPSVSKEGEANARLYDPVLGRFLSPDPYVQAPDNTQNYNRYSYCLNNPLIYTDTDGESIIAAIIVGAIVGAYIGGAAAEGWEYNPCKWAWNGRTWAGIGFGAVIGGAAGVGFYYAAPALAQTGFFSFFGTSGKVAAYTLTGGVAGGLAGYGAGFLGGMLYSDGNFGYSHQSGIHGAKVGATVGSVIGTISGNIESFEPQKTPSSVKTPEKSKWDGSYFVGSEEEAVDMLLFYSKYYGVETSYWSTSRGYYFEPIMGIAYTHNTLYDIDGSLPYSTKFDITVGFRANTRNKAYRYINFGIENDYPYIFPDNIFRKARVFYRAHTHPNNSAPGGADYNTAFLLKVKGRVYGWNLKNIYYNYGY